uniref:Uncharacterized protein n=1 Tax=Romanomermis culicivorax TaxID=13658 RepID=A0A915JC06_ROMCU
ELNPKVKKRGRFLVQIEKAAPRDTARYRFFTFGFCSHVMLDRWKFVLHSEYRQSILLLLKSQ